jgi:hypothetical protein
MEQPARLMGSLRPPLSHDRPSSDGGEEFVEAATLFIPSMGRYMDIVMHSLELQLTGNRFFEIGWKFPCPRKVFMVMASNLDF